MEGELLNDSNTGAFVLLERWETLEYPIKRIVDNWWEMEMEFRTSNSGRSDVE